jgi:hypothetical protein
MRLIVTISECSAPSVSDESTGRIHARLYVVVGIDIGIGIGARAHIHSLYYL